MLKYLLVLTFMLAGCASTSEEDFYEIKQGATKGNALAALGNPNRTYRRNSVDYWVYTVRGENGDTTKKILLFQNGKLLRVNHKIRPGKPKDSDFKEL